MTLLEQLTAPFPAACHKSRKIPGGNYYIYIPWEHYVDRLNHLLGLYWSVTYSDPVVAGDYLSIRAQLTLIWDGHTIRRDGIGTTRTYPERNDDGKEKIIGDPINNATRDALRDACYQFGIGRYLDDQDAVCQLLGVPNAEALAKRGKPKQKGEISREEWQRRKQPTHSA